LTRTFCGRYEDLGSLFPAPERYEEFKQGITFYSRKEVAELVKEGKLFSPSGVLFVRRQRVHTVAFQMG
jgi:hypothetical protein